MKWLFISSLILLGAGVIGMSSVPSSHVEGAYVLVLTGSLLALIFGLAALLTSIENPCCYVS